MPKKASTFSKSHKTNLEIYRRLKEEKRDIFQKNLLERPL